MRKRNILVGAGACLAALSLITPSALADPTGNPTTRILAGGGSDTTQDVMNALANVPASGLRIIGSYDASGSATIDTKIDVAGSTCVINRPVGSGNGVLALRDERAAAATANRRPCLDFARSSADLSDDARFNGSGFTFVPFARDAVSFATRADSAIPPSLTTAQLKAIYECTAAGTISNPPTILPLIPQSGSGTRTFFLQSIGVTTLGSCVSDRDPTNTAIGLIENTGDRMTDPRHIAPYSVAQFFSQFFDVITDVTGNAEIRRVNGIIPTSPTFPFQREVFNAIPTNEIGNAPYSTTFVGESSAICSSPGVITGFGFTLLPAGRCGAIDPTLQTPGGAGTDLPGPVN